MRPKIYSLFPDKNETAGKMDPCETHLLLPLEVDDGDNGESMRKILTMMTLRMVMRKMMLT